MPKVSEEMSVEQRQTALLKGLNATGEDEVVVNFSHLVHALNGDMKTAEKLASNLVETRGLIPSRVSSKKTLVRDALCKINRLDAIAAVNKAGIDKKVKS